MLQTLVLASSSRVRSDLLTSAHVAHVIVPARVDEDTMKSALLNEGASARDVADALAEAKSRKISQKRPADLVLGCDQVLEFDGAILSKPETSEMARTQLTQLRGKTHKLLSAAVLYENGQPIWRHVSTARLTMRNFSDDYLTAYLERNGKDIQHSVGGYMIEKEGVRLFARIDGDHFTILGMPLMEILAYLTHRRAIQS